MKEELIAMELGPQSASSLRNESVIKKCVFEKLIVSQSIIPCRSALRVQLSGHASQALFAQYMQVG